MKNKPEFERLEERVLLSGAPPYDSPVTSGVPFSYNNASGDVTCVLKGPGQGTWENDLEGNLFLELNGTDSRSSLRITGYADIMKLDINGSIKGITAKNSDVNGKVVIDGIINSLVLSGISEDASVEFNRGKPVPEKTYATVSIENVDGSLYACLPVRSAKLGNVVGAEISASDIYNFIIKGTLSNSTIQADYIKNLQAKGSVLETQVTSGVLLSLNVKENLSDSRINTKNGFKQGKLIVTGNLEDSFVGGFYQYSIKGNLTDDDIRTGEYTKKFTVGGSVLGSLIKSADNLGSGGTFEILSVNGDFRDSGLYVLYNPGDDNIYGGQDDSFIKNNALKPLIVNIKGTTANSWIGTSSTLQKASLKYIKQDNGGILFGLFCHDSGKIKIGTRMYIPEYFGDFTVEYITGTDNPPPDPF